MPQSAFRSAPDGALSLILPSPGTTNMFLAEDGYGMSTNQKDNNSNGTTHPEEDLAALRDEIDRIDDGIHDLIMRRAAIVEQIRAAKTAGTQGGNRQPGLFMRPGREADVLRRLLARHRGTLPAFVVARIWRELISAFCSMQTPFRVAVHAPTKSVGYWDMARNHYGSGVAMSLHTSAQRVLQMVSDGGAIGILTYPQDGESEPWWPAIALGGSLKVIARLPFYESLDSRYEELASLVVAPFSAPVDETGITLAALSLQEELSRDRLSGMLGELGYDAHIAASHDGDEETLFLLEIRGPVEAEEPAVLSLLEALADIGARYIPLGGYAAPIGILGAGD